jgi:hypothetical protein
MKRFRLLGLALLAVFSLGALIVASASAELPLLLPVKVGGSPWTGVNDGAEKVILETLKGEKVPCNKVKMSGTQETDTLGKYKLTFEECETVTGKCNSDGDAAGIILTEGEYHYVDDFLGTAATLGVAVLLLVSAHYLCPLVLILATGTLLCLILEPLVSMVTHLVHCINEAGTKGMPLDKHWWNDSGEEQTAVLLENKNEGAFEEASLLMLWSITFGEPVAFMNH